ncbi:MAG: penicillin acylase family protein [Bacteroidota bacterium]
MLCVVLIASAFFLHHLVTKSFPVTHGDIQLGGIQKEINIYRDEYGVPHILAGNTGDLMFAAGYVHAQDRLWQMDLSRRAGEGRLSEIFDTATVKYDKLFRTLGFAALAESIYRAMNPQTRQMLEQYAAGVNAYIETHKGKYPIEFDMLNYQPEQWKPRHSILISRLMAWELNFSWWEKLTYGELEAKLPPEKFKELIPSYPDSIPAPTPGIMNKKALLDKATLDDIQNFMAAARSYREWNTTGPFSGASNAWVVSGAKTLSGKPLLANDPHLKTSVPARWYEMHLSAPGWNVSGMTVPGVPFIVIGHNDSLAWGCTNAMLDDADFYLDKIDTSNSARYQYNKATLPIEKHKEMLMIGKKDSIEITISRTGHGPAINDVHPSTSHNSYGSKSSPFLVTLRWTGFEMSDELTGFVRINTAKNYREFIDGLKDITVPAQAIVYGDVAGNIGFWMAGRVPIRGKQNPLLPTEGWLSETEWKGFVPFDQLPSSWNPPQGYLICANQKLARNDYRYYLSNYWETPSRYLRIKELLTSVDKISTDDFERFQLDVLSPFNRSIVKHILAAYPADSTIENNDVKTALEYLHNWDYRDTPTEIASSIFNEFFVKLISNIYEDEMGPETFKDFVFFSAIPYRVTAQLLDADSSEWFDDIRTPRVETKTDIIHKSLLDAISALKQTSGPEMKDWQWGGIHQSLFQHPFGKRKPLDQVFNVGPFPAGGSATTVNKGDYQLNEPFMVYSGPSMRQIIDLGKPQIARTIIPLGQSGQAFHKHYKDQTPLWMNGGYHTVTIDRNEILSKEWERLVLKPLKNE